MNQCICQHDPSTYTLSRHAMPSLMVLATLKPVEDAGDVVVCHARFDFAAFLLCLPLKEVAEDELPLVLVGVACDEREATTPG